MTREPSTFSVKVGDVVIRLTSRDVALEPPPFYKGFLTGETKPDIDIQVYCHGLPEINSEKTVFDSGGVWKLYLCQGKYVFTFNSAIYGPTPYKLAIFERDFSRGEIHFPWSDDFVKRGAPDPLQYPLDELLLINYLSQGRGIDIHALGIIMDAYGLAFLGVSGAGKSTMAGLWKARKEARILCDDRLILRRQNGGFWIHGTPWHGDARIAIPGKAPLKSLFFLKQAKANRIVPLKPSDAATRLLVRCFPTFYHMLGMEYTLEFVTDLVGAVPCYELQFTPDQGAVDEVINHFKRISP
jgi:hypothetical protein